MSIYRSSSNNLGMVSARICQGTKSYISKNTVVRNHLKTKRERILLTWCYMGKSRDQQYSNTWCEVVQQDIIPGCDIALAEDCGKQDTEDIEDEEVIEGQATDRQSSNIGLLLARPRANVSNESKVLFVPSEAFTLHDLSDAQEEELMERTSKMNFWSSLAMVKRIAPQPDHLSLASCPIEAQRKRPKLT